MFQLSSHEKNERECPSLNVFKVFSSSIARLCLQDESTCGNHVPRVLASGRSDFCLEAQCRPAEKETVPLYKVLKKLFVRGFIGDKSRYIPVLNTTIKDAQLLEEIDIFSYFFL